MRRPVVVLVFLALLVVVGAWLRHWPNHFLSQSNDVPAVITGTGVDDGSPATAARSALAATDSVSRTSLRESAQPLPPDNAPLNDTLPALMTRAQAGDARAACRLGFELGRCRLDRASLATTQASMDGLAEQSRTRGSGANAREATMLGLMQDGADGAASCSDVDDATLSQSVHWLRVAADAGQTDALFLYAKGTMFPRPTGGYSLIGNPEFERWRRDAAGMMIRALQQGSADAAIAMATASTSDFSPFDAIIPDDPRSAAAYQRLASLLLGQEFGDPIPLTAQQTAVANALAEDWFQRYFGSRPPADRDLTKGWPPVRKSDGGTDSPCQ